MMLKRAKGMMLRNLRANGYDAQKGKGMMLRTQELIGVMLKRAKGMVLRNLRANRYDAQQS